MPNDKGEHASQWHELPHGQLLRQLFVTMPEHVEGLSPPRGG